MTIKYHDLIEKYHDLPTMNINNLNNGNNYLTNETKIKDN